MKNIIKKILMILTTIVSIASIEELIRLNILPMKYLLLCLLIIVVLLIAVIILVTRKNKVANIIGIVLMILAIFGNVFGIYHIHNINSFLDNGFKNKKTETIEYYVIAKKEKNYKKEDIAGEIGYYKESTNVQTAISKLKKKYTIEESSFDEINNLFAKLDSDAINFVLLEKTNYNIIMELDESKNESNYKIVYDFKINKRINVTQSQEEEKFNIYVGGTDYVGLMDFNTVITVNTSTHTILLTSIPRDYYVNVSGYNYKNKLSFITEGIDVSKNTVAELFDINIDYYIKIDSDSVIKLIDEIGGINYCSDYAYSGSARIHENGREKSIRYSIKKGCQTLDGYEAIAAARTRNAFNGRDRVRQQNMQKLLVAILQKLSSTEILNNYENILSVLSDSYETNIPKKIITKNIKDIINNGNKWTIKTQSVNGEDTKDTVHRFNNLVDWVMYPDEETVKIASDSIKNELK